MTVRNKRITSTARERRKISVRKKVKGSDERPRLSVFRSAKHTYAQVISDSNGKVIVHASTQQKEVLSRVSGLAKDVEARSKSSKSSIAARAVGLEVAERCKARKIATVVFDRNGYLYHGRVKAVADGAREGGLIF